MQRNHLSFFLAPRIPFAAADLVADARARTEINSHFGGSAGRADARRRDEVDVGHRRGAATKQMPARRRAPSGCGPQARWLCCSLLTYRPGYSSSLAPGQRAWGPAAKCEFISARPLRTITGRLLLLLLFGPLPLEAQDLSRGGFHLTAPLSLSYGRERKLRVGSRLIDDSVSVLAPPAVSLTGKSLRNDFSLDYKPDFE